MNNYEFGNFIADHRKRCGMKQRDLANKIGIREHYISDIETGKSMPKIEMIVKILDHIGCEMILKEKEGFIYQEDFI